MPLYALINKFILIMGDLKRVIRMTRNYAWTIFLPLWLCRLCLFAAILMIQYAWIWKIPVEYVA